MPDSEASALVFVASCLSNQFALPGKRARKVRGGDNSGDITKKQKAANPA